jgi:MHS family alpha-ketoglutarate permease-like MFS transporter
MTQTAASRLKAIVGGSIGNLVEWYDWYTYPSFALYFSKSIFPKGDQTAQLLSAAAVFAVGFLIRPLGGWFMGLYADRIGRRPALILSMVLMGAGSLMVALIPTYARIGLAAPVLLTIARFAQGLSVGGQYAASATYLSEVAGSRRAGFWTSFHYVTLLLGLFLAMIVLFTLQHSLTSQALVAWGWRIPFVIGAGLAIAALLLLLTLEETSSFQEKSISGATQKVRPWRALFEYRRPFAVVFFVTAAGTIAFQTYATYMPKFLVNTSGFAPDQATAITLAALVVYTLAHPLAGWLSDLVGRRAMLIAFSVAGILISVPVLSRLATASDPMTAFCLLTIGLLALSPYTAVSAIFKAELFPTEIRAFAIGLSFALPVSIFGGTSELIALLFKRMGHESWFLIYVTGFMVIALIASLSMPSRKNEPLPLT